MASCYPVCGRFQRCVCCLQRLVSQLSHWRVPVRRYPHCNVTDNFHHGGVGVMPLLQHSWFFTRVCFVAYSAHTAGGCVRRRRNQQLWHGVSVPHHHQQLVAAGVESRACDCAVSSLLSWFGTSILASFCVGSPCVACSGQCTA